MSPGRIGGALVGAAVVLFVIAAAIGLRGGTVFVGGSAPGSVLLTASLAVGAVGFAVLAIVRPSPFDGRLGRLGLWSLAVGLGCTVVSGIVAASSTVDPLESLPILVFSGIGDLLVLLGVVACIATVGGASRS
ncbi:MAG TPA: hypothetical protein VEY67_00640 [Candidatus Dormibacteraeota bacterium]|nr:hypothetical protein [Candidatus Dormibacteraeota bacterium]